MSTYLILIISIAAAAFLLFVVLNLRRSDSRGALAAAVSFPLCAVLGFVSAKLFYVILSELEVFLTWGEWEWDALFDLDPATFCFTGGAVGVLEAKNIKAIEDPEERAAYIAQKEAEYRDLFASPYQAANRGYIDDVIEPRYTRSRIIRAFEMLQTKRLTNPVKKHSNIPL